MKQPENCSLAKSFARAKDCNVLHDLHGFDKGFTRLTLMAMFVDCLRRCNVGVKRTNTQTLFGGLMTDIQIKYRDSGYMYV
jgi:hypothetical protein